MANGESPLILPPGAQQVIVDRSKTYEMKRKPVAHQCKTCGHTEYIVPPCCTEGQMIWRCKCNKEYKMLFHGHGRAAGESIFIGAF